MMQNKILKIRLVKFANTPPIISAWNIFDTEHAPFIHGKRSLGDGMEPSTLLIENKDFFLTIDEQRMPIFKFITRKSLMFHYRDLNNTVYQWSCFWGIPILQRFYVKKESDNNFKHVIDYAFELSGYKKFLAPIIKKYALSWMKNTWNEDLVMKTRYYKFLKYGFKNMKGLPDKISDREHEFNDEDIKIPLPKIGINSKNHPFFIKNIDKIFDE